MGTPLIGCYTTLDSTMRFYKARRGGVIARFGQKTAKVELPTLNHPTYTAFKTTAEKVQWLLGNTLFKPYYSDQVYFRSCDASDIDWKITQLKDFDFLPSGNIICRDRGQHKILNLRKNVATAETKTVDWKTELKKAGFSDQKIKSCDLLFQEEGFVLEHFVITSSHLFFTCRSNSGEFHILDLATEDDFTHKIEELAFNSITSLCKLSDSLISVGTEGPNGTVKIYSVPDLGECSIDSNPLLDDHSGVFEMYPLDNGEVVIITEKRQRRNGALVLTPYSKRDERKYQIEKLRAKIKHFPEEAENYRKLAQMYRVRHQPDSQGFYECGSKKCSQVSLSGIRPAVRQGHLYFARRFFEEARYYYEDEAFSVYESELERCGFTKELRRVKRLRYEYDLNNEAFKEIENPTSGSCKERLVVGGGNLTYVASLVKRHRKRNPGLPRAITATELREPFEDEKSTIRRLQQFGVTVLYGIDATQIDHQFEGRRFERIHWNCPFARKLKQPDDHKDQLNDFFRACFSLQKVGDRVHVTLRKSSFDRYEQESHNNALVAATASGYRLIRKRRMDQTRYRIYKPCKSETGEIMRDFIYQEFVFEKKESKIPSLKTLEQIKKQAEQYRDPDTKEYQVNRYKNWLYYDCSTDEDSSDYDASDDDDEPIKRYRSNPMSEEIEKKPRLV